MEKIINFNFWTLLFGLLLGFSSSAFPQFKELGPVEKQKFKAQASFATSRVTGLNELPFWDDFSQGIDTLKWEISGTTYTETIGNGAPSLGTILFDGVDASGRPYSLQIRDQGETDFLSTRTFDLSTLNTEERSSLYLSFYWQAGGKAEMPDTNDELVLQVLQPDLTWLNVWTQSGGSSLDREKFSQEIVQILPEWQHSAFQFRFISSGRKVGPFDSWLLDYVYLNTGRNSTDLTYKDRTLSASNQVTLGDFGAYPLELFAKNQQGSWSTVANEFVNLENRFRAMEYSISVRDSLGVLLNAINVNTPFNPVPNALERRSFLSREFEEVHVPNQESDLYFETYLTSGDDFLFTAVAGDTIWYSQVDFAQNDTVKSRFSVRDYFAYDHGTPDYAAGINQKSGNLAVRYQAPEPVFIKGISINFTNPSQANQAIDIVIWDDLSASPVYTKENVIPVKSEGDETIFFPLDANVRVDGEFYVGFTQFTNEFIHVGLDKTNDQGEKIHYNVGGGWVQNEDVHGSLMIWPHVSLAEPFEEGQLPEATYRLYPNPTTDLMTIEGKFKEIAIYDSWGRQILLPRESLGHGEIINFGGQRPGIYIVNLISDTEVKSFRVQVNK